MNSQGGGNGTALYMAAANGHANVTERLLRAGADPTPRSNTNSLTARGVALLHKVHIRIPAVDSSSSSLHYSLLFTLALLHKHEEVVAVFDKWGVKVRIHNDPCCEFLK